jgi:hypothetical protein
VPDCEKRVHFSDQSTVTHQHKLASRGVKA